MSESEKKTDDVEFKIDISSILDLPADMISRDFNEMKIYISPEKASWVNAKNELQVFLMEEFLRKRTIEEALNSCQEHFGEESSVVLDNLSDLLVEIEKKKLYQSTEHNDLNFMEFPIVLLWYITEQCNFSCAHCYRDASLNKPKNELSTKECLDILKEVRRLGCTTVTFTGGEALLKKDIFEIMKYSKDLGMATQVLSNGSLLNNREIIQKIDASANRIQISLDGTCAEINDKIRGEGSFNKIMTALKYLEETEHNLEVSLSITVARNNYLDLEKNLISFIKKLNIEKLDIIIGKATSHGRAELCEGDLIVDYKTISPIMHKILEDLEELGWHNPAKHQRIGLRLKNCSWGVGPVLDQFGNFMLCTFCGNPIGNVKEIPFEELLGRARNIHKENLVDSLTECADCEIRYICGGGCKIRNMKYNGDYKKTYCDQDYKDYFYYQMSRNQLS